MQKSAALQRISGFYIDECRYYRAAASPCQVEGGCSFQSKSASIRGFAPCHSSVCRQQRDSFGISIVRPSGVRPVSDAPCSCAAAKSASGTNSIFATSGPGPERRNAVDTRQKCIRQLIIKADFATRVALTITAAVDQVGCCQLQSALLPCFAQHACQRRFTRVNMSGRGQIKAARK